MVQLTIKPDINQSRIDVLLHMLQSWDLEAEIATISSAVRPPKSIEKRDLFSNTRGMWKDRDDVSDKQLREKAWGTNKRLTI